MIEGFRDVLAERVTRTTRRDTPTAAIIRIRPEQIAHGSFVGHLLDSVEGADVVERVDAGREPTVQAEDLVVDEGREGEEVEQVGEVFPHIGVAVFPEAFIIFHGSADLMINGKRDQHTETVDLRDLTGFMVSPENGDALGKANLESDQQRHRLDRVVTAVHVVTWRGHGWSAPMMRIVGG